MSFIAYQSGRYSSLDEVRIALNDAGFAFGVTVTDQCRTYGQKPFRLQDHLDRFQQSCQLCDVACPATSGEIQAIIEELLKRNVPLAPANTEWTIVWLATPGLIGSFLGQPGGILDSQSELVVYCFPLDTNRFAHYYTQGAEVWVAESVRSIPTDIHPAQAKQRSRLHWWLAEREVKKKHPKALALLLDQEGFITETALANLVLVREGTVLSPKRSKILPGVSLKVVMEICAREGIRFQEADIRQEELATVEEAIVCSTPFGIAPVGLIEGLKLEVNGVMFRNLWQGWQHKIATHLSGTAC